ncbi:MAG: hypothetical protein J6A65_13605, partial [Pseudomonas sp.]|nr:hypothetical protein [Pseudomonas sp.]
SVDTVQILEFYRIAASADVMSIYYTNCPTKNINTLYFNDLLVKHCYTKAFALYCQALGLRKK